MAKLSRSAQPERALGNVLSEIPALDGLGWSPGVGRIESIVGPVTAGWFIAQQWSTQPIFLALAVPAFVSARFVFSLRWTEIETAGQHF
jgi:hypothetical protein